MHVVSDSLTPVTKPLLSPVLRFAAEIWAGPGGVCPCGLPPNQIRSPRHRSNVLWRARKAPGPGGPETQLVLAGSWTCIENQGHFLGCRYRFTGCTAPCKVGISTAGSLSVAKLIPLLDFGFFGRTK